MIRELNKVDLYVDMDGTIAKFYEHANCLERMYEPGFFASLNAYENVIQALLILHERGINLYALSALPAAECRWVIDEKKEWIAKTPLRDAMWYHIFTNPGEDKAKRVNVRGYSPRIQVLLDDYNNNLEQWVAAGGLAIKFVNEINDRALLGPLWAGDRVRHDWSPERIAQEIIRIIAKKV